MEVAAVGAGLNLLGAGGDPGAALIEQSMAEIGAIAVMPFLTELQKQFSDWKAEMEAVEGQ